MLYTSKYWFFTKVASPVAAALWWIHDVMLLSEHEFFCQVAKNTEQREYK